MKSFIKLMLALFITVFVVACHCDDDARIETVNIAMDFTTLAGPLNDGQGCGDPPFFHIKLEGDGTDAFLGNFDVYCTLCSNMANGAFNLNEDDLCIFTTANDDELRCKLADGQFMPTATEGVAESNQAFTIIGGTGQFENAAGGGHAKVTLNRNNGTTSQVWIGSIDFLN